MQSYTIAVIDDDATMLELIGTLLTDEGYEVLRWPTAKPAYDLIRQHRPDLVIIDLRMEHPQAGWLVIHMLRLDPTTASIPVLLCTADDQYVRRQAEELRRHRVSAIVKPFAADELVRAVAQLLADPEAPQSPAAGSTVRGGARSAWRDLLGRLRDAVLRFGRNDASRNGSRR